MAFGGVAEPRKEVVSSRFSIESRRNPFRGLPASASSFATVSSQVEDRLAGDPAGEQRVGRRHGPLLHGFEGVCHRAPSLVSKRMVVDEASLASASAPTSKPKSRSATSKYSPIVTRLTMMPSNHAATT